MERVIGTNRGMIMPDRISKQYLIALIISTFCGAVVPIYGIYFAFLIASGIFVIIFFIQPKGVIYSLVLASPLLLVIAYLSNLNPGSEYFSINLYGLINVFFPAIGLCFLVVNRADIFQYRMTRPIIFFFTILLISITFSPDKFFSLRQVARYAMHAMVYFIVLASFKDSKDIRTIFRLAVISSVIPLIAGFRQLILHDPSYPLPGGMGLIRIYGTFCHPSTYAMFLVIFSLFILFLANEASQKTRWLYYILFILFVISLFFTFTRVGWLSFFVALSIMGALKYRKAYFLLISVGVSILLALPQVSDRIINRFSLVRNDSIWGRFKLNDFSWRLFQQKPIFGQVIGSYQLLSPSFATGSKTEYGHKSGTAPHNDYMRFLSETGMFGLFAYLILMYYAMRISVEFYMQSDDQIRRYGAFLISLIVAFLIFGITDQAFEYGGFYFWLFLAIGELFLKNIPNANCAVH
jgi:O-antigen ligase